MRNEGIIKDIRDAYTWLTYGVKITEPVSNTYYNYSKACIYYHFFVDKNSNKLIEAEEYLDRYRLLFGDSTSTDYGTYSMGFLFTLRNKYEAEEKYDEAREINKKIQEKGGSEIGDTKEADEIYKSKIKQK